MYAYSYLEYYYSNGNALISIKIRNDKIKATLTHMYIELVISKPTTTSVWTWKREITKAQFKRTQQKFILYEYTIKPEVAIEFSKRREHEPSTSRWNVA